MQPHNPDQGPYSDLYREFVDYVQTDIQRERRAANRRMFSVFFWSFLVPAVTSAVLIVLIKLGVLPRRMNRYIDWLIVVFPIAYALYILSFDVLREAPNTFRRGGLAAMLGKALDEEKWRARVCEAFKQKQRALSEEKRIEGWKWVIRNFRIDLQNLQNRTRYLTALAGAVFFLIFQGIDAFDSPHHDALAWSTSSIMGWFESSSSSLTQFVGLGIFLMLLYVSGNQAYISLFRYLQCAELVIED